MYMTMMIWMDQKAEEPVRRVEAGEVSVAALFQEYRMMVERRIQEAVVRGFRCGLNYALEVLGSSRSIGEAEFRILYRLEMGEECACHGGRSSQQP